MPIPWRRGGALGACTNSGNWRFRPDPAGPIEAMSLDAVLGEVKGITVVKVGAGGLSGRIIASGGRMLAHERPVVVAATDGPGERTAVRTTLESLGYRELACYGWSPTWLWSPDPACA